MEMSLEMSAELVPCTQWSGQRTWSPVGQLDCFERLLPGMCRCKRDVVRRMPVLSHHDVREGPGDPFYDRNSLPPVLSGEPPARKETVLHIHYDQHASLVR